MPREIETLSVLVAGADQKEGCAHERVCAAAFSAKIADFYN